MENSGNVKMTRWLRVSEVLIVVGITLLFINYAVYAPRFRAFENAVAEFAKNHLAGHVPSFEAYGLDGTSFFISWVLGTVGSIAHFIGGSYVVILLIGKIVRQI